QAEHIQFVFSPDAEIHRIGKPVGDLTVHVIVRRPVVAVKIDVAVINKLHIRTQKTFASEELGNTRVDFQRRTDVVIKRPLYTRIVRLAVAFQGHNFIVIVLFKFDEGRGLDACADPDVPYREIDRSEFRIETGSALLVISKVVEVRDIKGVGGVVDVVFGIIRIVFLSYIHVRERCTQKQLVAVIATQGNACFGYASFGFHLPELLHFAELTESDESGLAVNLVFANDAGGICHVFNVIGIIGVGQSVTSVGILSQVGEIGGNGAAWVVTLV